MEKKYKTLVNLSYTSMALLLICAILTITDHLYFIYSRLYYCFFAVWLVTVIYAIYVTVSSLAKSQDRGYTPDYELAHKTKVRLVLFFVCHFILCAIFIGGILPSSVTTKFWFWLLFNYIGVKGTFFIMFATSADLIVPTMRKIHTKIRRSYNGMKEAIIPLISVIFLTCFVLDVIGIKLLEDWDNKEL